MISSDIHPLSVRYILLTLPYHVLVCQPFYFILYWSVKCFIFGISQVTYRTIVKIWIIWNLTWNEELHWTETCDSMDSIVNSYEAPLFSNRQGLRIHTDLVDIIFLFLWSKSIKQREIERGGYNSSAHILLRLKSTIWYPRINSSRRVTASWQVPIPNEWHARLVRQRVSLN